MSRKIKVVGRGEVDFIYRKGERLFVRESDGAFKIYRLLPAFPWGGEFAANPLPLPDADPLEIAQAILLEPPVRTSKEAAAKFRDGDDLSGQVPQTWEAIYRIETGKDFPYPKPRAITYYPDETDPLPEWFATCREHWQRCYEVQKAEAQELPEEDRAAELKRIEYEFNDPLHVSFGDVEMAGLLNMSPDMFADDRGGFLTGFLHRQWAQERGIDLEEMHAERERYSRFLKRLAAPLRDTKVPTNETNLLAEIRYKLVFEYEAPVYLFGLELLQPTGEELAAMRDCAGVKQEAEAHSRASHVEIALRLDTLATKQDATHAIVERMEPRVASVPALKELAEQTQLEVIEAAMLLRREGKITDGEYRLMELHKEFGGNNAAIARELKVNRSTVGRQLDDLKTKLLEFGIKNAFAIRPSMEPMKVFTPEGKREEESVLAPEVDWRKDELSFNDILDQFGRANEAEKKFYRESYPDIDAEYEQRERARRT